MADYSYKFSHLGNFTNIPPRKYDSKELSKREAKLKGECKRRLENSTSTELGQRLIWHHIFTTTKA